MTVEGVVVGWAGDHAYSPFVDSLLKLYERGSLVGHVGGKTRNDVVAAFLERVEPWLLLTGPDAVLARDTVELLLEAARQYDLKLVGALSFDGDPKDEIHPGAYRLEHRGGDRRRLDAMENYADGLLQGAHAVDAHALLVHREVLEAIRAIYEPHTALVWFAPQSRELDGKLEAVDEQVVFCVRAQEAGYPIRLHCGIRAGRTVLFTLQETDHQLYIMRREEQDAYYRSQHSVDLTPGKFTVRINGIDVPANPHSMSRSQRRRFIREQGTDSWKRILNGTIQVPVEKE